MRHLFFSVSLALGLASGSLAYAQSSTETGNFDVYYAGIKAGELRYGMTRNGHGYAASGLVKSSGLVAAISDFRFRAESRGRISGDRYRPARYEESSDTGRRKSEKVIRYPGGVPTLERTDKPKEYWLNPRAQGDALDPLTAVWHLLRDRDADELCTMDESYFDGARRVRLTTSRPKKDGDKVACTGHYIRVGGFSKKEIREGTKFPFSVRYAPDGKGRYKLSRMDVKTLRGRAVLIRR